MTLPAKWPFDVGRVPFFYGWVIWLLSTIGLWMTVPGQTMGMAGFTDYFIVELGLSRLQRVRDTQRPEPQAGDWDRPSIAVVEFRFRVRQSRLDAVLVGNDDTSIIASNFDRANAQKTANSGIEPVACLGPAEFSVGSFVAGFYRDAALK